MNKAQVTKNAVAFVQKQLGKEGTGHDWWHIERVRNNAKAILKSEKADRFVVDMAVLLHDVGDRKVIGKEEDDYTIAENFLKRQGVPAPLVEEIMLIIKTMSFSSSFEYKGKKSKELQVVQDADRLDALGAIGIARLFAFGGKKSRPLHDPAQQARSFRSTKEYQKAKSSSFNHFYEKILLLKDLMNTKAAKRIARERHRYIEAYMKQFLLEWEGKR